MQTSNLKCPTCSRPCQATTEPDDDFIERVSADPVWYFHLYQQEETEEFGVIEVPQLHQFKWVKGLCAVCAEQQAKRQRVSQKYAKAEKLGQTSLFDLEPVADANEPLPVPIVPAPTTQPTTFFPLVNEYAELFYLSQAQVLLKAMTRILLSRHLEPEVKQYEFLRHHHLRQKVLMMVRPAALPVESEQVAHKNSGDYRTQNLDSVHAGACPPGLRDALEASAPA